jgi:hypothetical protein
VALQVGKQIAEIPKTLARQILITGDAIRFNAIRAIDAVKNRTWGRQARQAHPRESDAALIQRVARRENGMEERFFKITDDLDRFCHASYTQNDPIFSGGPAPLPDGKDARTYLARLAELESAAKESHLGGWKR